MNNSDNQKRLAARFAFLGLVAMVLAVSCNPYVEPGIELSGPLPTVEFDMEVLASNPNLVHVALTGDTGFQYTWNFGGISSSTKPVDTAYFPDMGNYDIELTVGNSNGQSTMTKSVTIVQDDTNICANQTLVLLTGGCDAVDGKRWQWSQAVGALTVGSGPGLDDYFVSPAGALAPEQYDDFFDFLIEGQVYNYENNGLTIFPETGYTAEPYDPPASTFSVVPGAGFSGEPQIIMSPEISFMGTKDSGPTYDILTLTETELVVQSPLRDGSGGYFTFYFEAVP